jgi:hypothetical protein
MRKRARTGLTLSGPGVDAALEAELAAWLQAARLTGEAGFARETVASTRI